MHSLPIFVRLAGRPVILVGEGEAADAKRRLLERAGAVVVGEDGTTPLPLAGGVGGGPVSEADLPKSPAPTRFDLELASGKGAALAIVVDDDAAVARLKARGVLVNAVDRAELCDFTLPAIVDRSPVIVAVGTGGASAGLAAALRQRLEAILPAGLGRLADALFAGRGAWRERYPDGGERRRAIAAALGSGGELDLLDAASPARAGARSPADRNWAPDNAGRAQGDVKTLVLASPDPDDLTMRQARLLANADRVTHGPDVPRAILDRARADAARIETDAPPVDAAPGLTIDVRMSR